MSLIKPKAPRFYREENGVVEACYTMPKKSGDGIKEPDIRDARELGLLPSVTTILGVLAKPGLERWKIEQAIHSALTLPRERISFNQWIETIGPKDSPICNWRDLMELAYEYPPQPTESEDVFAKRVVQDMDAQAAKAAEFGTRIHDAIADVLNRPIIPSRIEGIVPGELRPYLDPFSKWVQGNIEQVHAVEKVVGGKHCGYAGRLDLDCTIKGVGRTICDIKSQGVKEGKPPVFYKEWPLQLAAYAGTYDEPMPNKLVSVVIDSRAPGPVWPKVWEESLGTYYGRFEECQSLWSYLNDYYPQATKAWEHMNE